MAATDFDAALKQLLLDAVRGRAQCEAVALATAAGRVLAADLHAPIAVPGFANAAMDGYAMRTLRAGVRAGQQFRCADLALAGAAALRVDDSGSCSEIATGALLPDGADTVVNYEITRRDGDLITVLAAVAHAANVRGAEDDYAAGQIALRAGRVLDAGALGVLASFGFDSVVVRRRPRVAIIVTGSELVPAGQVLARGQIHDSNSLTLRTLLAPLAESLSVLGPVVDERARLREVMVRAAAEHEVVITAGGASAGRADFVPELLRELGEIRLWKVAMRPGMPFLYGAIGDTRVYGLPGNPVSVFATAVSLVLPALRAMQGRAPIELESARLAVPVEKRHDRLEWRRGTLFTSGDGRRLLRPHAALGSGMLRGVAESNALFRIEAATRRLGADALVDVLPFPA
ncbi:MAG: molybdopterin molybdotransferase MoeA [Xanthomonadales bacterium]|nr:molybdopterin molybdotransferase MoeA [Xanthomonadales bacterium]